MTEPPLQLGDTGAAVTRLQERLQALRFYDGPLDGCLGERTSAAVSLLRAHAGEPGDGPVDATTWQLLDRLTRTVEIRDPFLEPDDAPSRAAPPADEEQWRWDGDRWEHAGADDAPDDAAVAAARAGAGAVNAHDRSPHEHWVWDGDRWQPA